MNEALEAVIKINEELITDNEWMEGHEFDMFLIYQDVGFGMGRITYLGNIIWNEQDDDREFIEETNKYINMYCHLKLKMDEFKNAINSVKF